jgi:PAS domain S-box-containing protein
MTDSLHRSAAGEGLPQSFQGITEANVLISEMLASRPTRLPNFAAENQALRTLAQHLTDDPQSLLKTLVRLALDLCRADTVGVSLLETAPDGTSFFRWVAIAGALEALEQSTTPSDFSPCGTTLACNQPQLYSYPERFFTYLFHPQFSIVEGLLIPLCVNDRPLGTLWIISHSEARCFDAEDQRLITSLGGFTASALCSLQQMQQIQQTVATALRHKQFNQQILDSSDDCIKVLDLEGRLLFMSQPGQALLGIQDITPFLNASWAEFWKGDDQQAAIKAIAKARAGEVYTFQGYRPTLNGTPKWWDIKVSPIRGAEGQVERLLCISRDITARRQSEDKRKQAEERLRKSEEQLSAIFSQAAVGLSEISLDGYFQRVNDELCQILGRSREELLAVSIPNVTHPEDVLKSLKAFQQVVETGKPVSFDKRYLRSDGTIVWANSSLTRLDDEQGHPRTVLAVTVDLSDRKQAEENLRQSEERYRAIVSQVITGVASSEIDGRLTIVNQKYCDITGYSAAELSQLRLHDITHPDDLPRNVELYNRMLTEGTPFEIEKRYIRKDGSIVWVNNYVSPICDRNGKPQSVVAVVLDITERKQAEAALAASEAKYRTLFSSMDEGYCLADVIFDENDQPIDIFYIDANPAATRLVGQDFTGRRLSEINPDYESYWYEIFGRVARTGEGERLEQYAALNQKWYDFYVFKMGGEDSRRVAIVFQDITERKRREANAAFLLGMTEAFSHLSTADEIMQVVGAKVGEYLNVTTCNFADVDEARGEVMAHYGWNSPDMPRTVGTFRITEYLNEEFVRANRDGETFVICDTQTDPRTDGLAYAALNMYAFVTVPFHRNGRWMHYMAICDSRPRDWRDDEIDLIRDISNCIFPRLERARAEAALRKSEAKYRSLFDSMDEGFCILQLIFDEEQKPIDYRFIEVNPAFEQQTGLKHALSRTILELVPDIELFWIDLYGRVAVTGEPKRFTDYSRVMDRWFDVNAFRIGEPHEHKVALLFKDITDRKQAEEMSQRTAKLDTFRLSLADALRPLADPVEVQATAARVLGEYLNANRVAYFEVRGADYVVERDYVNGVAALAGGYPIDSFGSNLLAAYRAGHTVSVSDVETDANLSPEQRSAYAAIQIGAYIGIPLVKDGEFVAGLAIHSSEPRAWTEDEVVLAEEVAERTWAAVDRARAEAIIAADLQDTQRLRELGAKLVIEGDIQTLYQEILSTAIAIMQADAGTVQIFDAATQDLALLATQGFEQAMHESFCRVNASFNTSCGIALRTGTRSFVDFDVPESEDPDGSLRLHVEAGFLSAQSTPLITRAGRLIGMVSTHWHQHHRPNDSQSNPCGNRQLRFLDLLARQAADLIEQRQTVAEREQLLAREQAARVEADRANRIKDEFLAVLSHELRSPLNPILGWAKLLQNRKLDAAKTQQALQTIERNAQLQSELIEDLLDVSRILQGKLNLNVSSINLSATIRAAMETVRLAAEAKSINLKASFDPDPPLVQGDSTRLQQVIWNLLSNAVKFTPTGGQVNIRLERLDSFAQITVSDTGQGIEPDFLPYVFEYFRQANATTTRKFGGLGLGLAIVRHLVELHGGTVAVESAGVGRGATFTVRLPLMPIQAIAHQNSPLSEPLSTLSGTQVLVVDDEPDSRDFVGFVLEQAGATVLAASTAAEALTMLVRFKPTVLLSDIGMPDMDGYMLMQQVRALPPEQGGQVRAIALTAYAGDFNQQQALAAGFQKHISKPVEPEKLIQVISSLIKSA